MYGEVSIRQTSAGIISGAQTKSHEDIFVKNPKQLWRVANFIIDTANYIDNTIRIGRINIRVAD